MEASSVITDEARESTDIVYGGVAIKRQLSLVLGRPTLQRTQTSDLLRTNVDQVAAHKKKEQSRKKEKSDLNRQSRVNSGHCKPSTETLNENPTLKDGRKISKAETKPFEIDSDEDTPWKDSEDKPDLSYIPVKEPKDETHIENESTYDSSDFYDTDLESDGERDATPLDTDGKRTYQRLCRRLQISIVGAVLSGLKTNVISVKGRGMDGTDALALASALLENSKVKSLHLDDNQLGPRGVEFVSLMLFENIYITDLSVAENRLGSKGCALIVEMLLENHTINKLNLSGNNLTDSDASLISNVLQDNLYLTSLDLSHNDISDTGAQALGQAIADNENLRSLDLSWNKIRPNGGVSLCEGLQENVVLNTLSLAYNGLSVIGAKAMGEALELNEVLTHLDLTCNHMFDGGVGYIARAIMINESLKMLRVSNNAMTTASALTMLNAVKGNPDTSLQLLDMSSVHVYKDTLNVVEEIKFVRPEFEFLYGGVVNSDDSQGGGSGAEGLSQRNPMTMLREFMSDRNLRIVDLFKQLDKDGSGSLSRDEFIIGLKSIKVPMSNAQIDRLIHILDKDGDGEIDFSEMLTGDREHRRKQMKLKQQAVARMLQLKKAKKLAKMKAAQAAEAKAMASMLPVNKKEVKKAS